MKIILCLLLAAYALTAPPAAEAQIGSTPHKDEFIDISEEPQPITEIQTLVVYPPDAQRLGVEGQVVVSALIDEMGNVVKVDIEKSDHPMLEQAAVDALYRAKFKPAMQGSKPVKVWITYPIRFKLNNNDRWPSTGGEDGVSSTPTLSGSKPAQLIGDAPMLEVGDGFAGRNSIVFDLQIGTYGDVIDIRMNDLTIKDKITEPMLKVIRGLKFIPGEIDNKPRVTRLNFPVKIRRMQR